MTQSPISESSVHPHWKLSAFRSSGARPRVIAVVRWFGIGFLAASTCAGAQTAKESEMILENDALKVTVSPVGGRIISLYDKVHRREEVKVLPYISGINEVRYSSVLNVKDGSTPFTLSVDRDARGNQTLKAVAKCEPTEELPAAATITKEYTLPGNAGRIQMVLEIANEGKEEIALMPWVRNLLNRGLKAQPEEAHMTEYGAFLRGNPIPHKPAANKNGDWHFFPASNWTSRVVLPEEENSNTLAMILRPDDMLKIYNWHRGLEDFCTQEFIAAPMFVKPGERQRWEYFMVVAAPVRNIVHCSPQLVIGVSPHPTGIPAATKELTLSFAATETLSGVHATARFVSLAEPQRVIGTHEFDLPGLSQSGVVRKSIPVELKDQTNYQLRLNFTRDGKPWFPGAAAGDRDEVIVPLVVGTFDTPEKVFPLRTKGVSRLPRIQPRNLKMPRALTGADFDAFAFSAGERCFREDKIEAGENAPVQLHASRGEYESCQVLLVPKGGQKKVFAVAAEDLVGPGGSRVHCESVNEFIYVPTQIPSGYNARKLIGEYPEALVPIQTMTLEGESNHPLFLTYRVPAGAQPGLYRGVLRLTAGKTPHDIPVEMTVWNITIPLRSKFMEPATSLKMGNLRSLTVKAPDGHTLTPVELQKAIVDLHLKYRLTPCDSGIVRNLLALNFPAFESEMQEFVSAGATKIYLGSIPQLMAKAGDIPKIDAYLKEKGWRDYFYVRAGFDEASTDLIPKIRANCEQWKKVSTIPIMETYYHDEPRELFGMLDIWSRPLARAPWIQERMAAGDRFWRVNTFPNDMETPPWRIRKTYINLFDHKFTGTYIWTVKYWDGITKWGEDYWSDAGVANLGAVLMWPHESGLLSTIRLEALRDAIEDNALFWMLREKVNALEKAAPKDRMQAVALQKARTLCSQTSLSDAVNSTEDLERLRVEVGETLSALNGNP
jgi:hypothetical protein